MLRHGNEIERRTGMIETFVLIAFLSGSSMAGLPLSTRGSFCRTDRSAFPTFPVAVPPGQAMHIAGGYGVNYTTTAKWIITTSAQNLSFFADPEKLKLQGQACQSGNLNRSSTIMIRVYQDATAYLTYPICSGRPLNEPLVSTARIEVMYCDGIPGDSFQFNIFAKIGGMLQLASPDDQRRNVKVSKVTQWLLLTASRQDGLVINFTQVDVKAGSAGGCRRGFLKVNDRAGSSLLPNGEKMICNRGGRGIQKTYTIITTQSIANVSFKGARFDITYHSEPKSTILSYPPKTTRKEGVTVATKTLSASNSSSALNRTGNTGASKPASNNNNKTYELIGLGCAGLLVLVVIILIVLFLRKRRKKNLTRSSSMKARENTSVTQYADQSQLESNDGVKFINNVMYEKIVKSNRPLEETDPRTDDNVFSFQKQPERESLLRNNSSDHSSSEVEKRMQRLSQLDGVYLGVDNRFKKPESNNVTANLQHRPPLFSPDMSERIAMGPPLSATFHKDRPPLPPPEAEKVNYYSSIKPISKEEEVRPAYATVTPEGIQPAPFPVQRKVVPEVGQYQSSAEIRPAIAPLPEDEMIQPAYAAVTELSNTRTPAKSLDVAAAQYISSDELRPSPVGDNATEDKKKPKKTYQVVKPRTGEQQQQLPNISLPTMDNDGYLLFTSSENLEQPNVKGSNEANTPVTDRSYVSVNSTSQEDVRRHFARRKKMPRPGTKQIARSMPELVAKQIAAKERPQLPSKTASTDFLKAPDAPISNQYKKPRPSAPDIFIQCAYTSSTDLSRIHQGIEQAANRKLVQSKSVDYTFNVSAPSDQLNPAEYGSAGSDNSCLYDSPRRSTSGSNDSLLDERLSAAFYDAPRPSLPSIFPDDLQKFVTTSK